MAHWFERGYWTAYSVWSARHEAQLPYWTLERVLRIQRQRLRRVVGHAYRNVPFYREVMDRMRSSPDDIQAADDLHCLPIVTKEDLLEAPDSFRARNFTDGRCLRLDSSGTSGRSKPIHHDAQSLFLSLAHGQRQRAVLRQFTGKAAGYREMHAARAGGVHRQIRDFYESHSLRLPGVELQRADLPLINVSLAEQVALINEFRPTALRGYGSQLGSLFRRVAEQGLHLEVPKVVVYGADTMPQAERELIEAHFGVPVLSTYQAVEALRLGFQCEERKGFHLSLDDVAFRVVDDEGHDVVPGERGHLLISNLTNFATVLLNYRLGDIVRLAADPCACGRSLPTIESIEGRSDDLVVLPSGEEIHSLAILEPLRAVPGVIQIQLIQQGSDQFELRCVPESGIEKDGTAKALLQALSVGLGAPVAAHVTWMEQIPSDSSGKTKAVVSNCRLVPNTEDPNAV